MFYTGWGRLPLRALLALILNLIPGRLGRHFDMPLFVSCKRRVQGAQRYGYPVSVFTLAVRPEQRRTALAAKFTMHGFRGLVRTDKLRTFDEVHISARNAAIAGKRSPMAFAALAAMAMRNCLGA